MARRDQYKNASTPLKYEDKGINWHQEISLEVPHFGWLHRKCTVKTITNMRFEKASMRIRG